MKTNSGSFESSLMSLLVIMMVTASTVVVDNNIMWIYYSFVKIRILDFDFGRAIHFLTPSRVELIDKRSILCLETITIR